MSDSEEFWKEVEAAELEEGPGGVPEPPLPRVRSRDAAGARGAGLGAPALRRNRLEHRSRFLSGRGTPAGDRLTSRRVR
jgi:hypothetical protein